MVPNHFKVKVAKTIDGNGQTAKETFNGDCLLKNHWKFPMVKINCAEYNEKWIICKHLLSLFEEQILGDVVSVVLCERMQGFNRCGPQGCSYTCSALFTFDFTHFLGAKRHPNHRWPSPSKFWKPLTPMYGLSKKHSMWWSHGSKTIEKPSMSMVAWKKH